MWTGWQVLLVILVAPFVVYAVVRIVTTAYFKSKRDFLREIFHHGNSTGDRKNGNNR